MLGWTYTTRNIKRVGPGIHRLSSWPSPDSFGGSSGPPAQALCGERSPGRAGDDVDVMRDNEALIFARRLIPDDDTID